MELQASIPGPPPPPPAKVGASATPPWKAYSPGQVALAVAIGSPIAGAWLLSQNFRRLGMRRRGTVVLLVSVAVILVALWAAFFGPNGRSSSYSGGSFLLVAVYYAYAKTQGPMIAKQLAAGSTFHSWWRAGGVGVLTALALLAAGIFGIVVAALLGYSVPE